MVLTEKQQNEFETAARPLIEWLNKNCHPHVTAIIGPGRAELLDESMYTKLTREFIRYQLRLGQKLERELNGKCQK